VWRLYLNSPPPFVGAVVFGFSQRAVGDPYIMICGPTEGAIQCRETFDHLELDVVPRPSLTGLLSGTDARNTP
jgi:hypothetical protein